MQINHQEIIEDIEGQIRKCGGLWDGWCAGTAKDSRRLYFQRPCCPDTLQTGLNVRKNHPKLVFPQENDLMSPRPLT